MSIRTKKLLFIQPTSLFDGYGGVEYYLHDLACSAVELLGKDNVKVVLPQRKTSNAEITTPYEVSKVPYRFSGILGKVENRFSPWLWSAAKKEIENFKPDLIVCGHVHIAPLVAALSEWTGVPFVTIAYGIEIWGVLPLLQTIALDKSKSIWSISDWTKDQMVLAGMIGDAVEIMHPRVFEDLETMEPKTKFSAGKEPLKILTVSRLSSTEQYKGQDHVLRALHALRDHDPEFDFRYTICGDGEDKARLRELADSLGLGDLVEFLPGRKSRSELYELYVSHDLYVMPSRFGRSRGKFKGEGFGIVFAEAGILGVPSIAYDVGGVKDIIVDGHTGRLVKMDSIEELAKAIYSFHRDRKLLSQLGQSARALYLDKFTRHAAREQLAQLI